MAEPAPIYDDDEQSADPNKPAWYYQEHPRGGGETTPRKKGHLKSIASPDELAEAEASPEASTGAVDKKEAGLAGGDSSLIPGGFRNDEELGFLGRVRALAVQRRKGLAIGGGVGGVIVSIVFILFLSLIPLKINNLVENLQNRFFRSTRSALRQRTADLREKYLKKYVLPSLNGKDECKSTRTIDKSCIATIPGATPADRLFRSWRDNRLENKLATDYGIEFARNTDGSFKVSIRDVGTANVDKSFLTDDRTVEDVVGAGRNDVRQRAFSALDDAMEGETRRTKILNRFKVASLLQRKYDIRFCVFACKLKDNFDDWKDTKKTAAQRMIIRRVVQPHTDILGFALECILDPNCSEAKNTTYTETSDGERQDAMERKIQAYLEQKGFEFEADTVAKIAEVTNQLAEKGLQAYLVDKVVSTVTQGSVEEAGTKALPIIGWIDMSAKAVSAIKDFGPKLRRWAFVINSTGMVSLYMLYRTQADELKNGRVDPALLGSMVDQLGDNAGDANHKDQPAEVSPLYQQYFGNDSTNTNTALLDIFSPTAYAQAQGPTGTSHYTCDDNKPVPKGKSICDEESLVSNNFLATISDAFSSPPLNVLSGVAGAWNGSFGQILGAVNNTIGQVLGAVDSAISAVFKPYADLKAVVTDNLQRLLELVGNWLIPSPISEHMSGGRTMQMLAGGADAAGNQYGQYGIGGQKLTDQQSADILNNETAQDRLQFASRPFFSRLFATDTPYSLISQVAATVPFSNGVGMSQHAVASLLGNPFSKLASSFGSIFASPRLYAATAQPDPFGIAQYGYPLNDPTLSMSPDIFTDTYCAKLNKTWAENDVKIDPATGAFLSVTPITTDPQTGMDVHKTTNPCMLESVTTGAAGGYYNTSLLGTDAQQ